MNKSTIGLLVAVATLSNYAIWTQAENNRLNNMLKLSDMRSNLSQEWTNEVTFSLLNKLNDNHEDGLRTQGRLEGIVEYISNTKDYQSVWHEGYQQGLNQSEEMAKIEKEIDENAPFDKPIKKSEPDETSKTQSGGQ